MGGGTLDTGSLALDLIAYGSLRSISDWLQPRRGLADGAANGVLNNDRHPM